MRVSFPTANPYVPRDMRDPAMRARTLDCPAELYLPSRPVTNRPAVVVSEGLGGPKPVRELHYGAMLAERGYVALVPDSFAARGVAQRGDAIRALSVTTAMMLADAFAALRFLGGHPAVCPAAVSIVGFSYGGMVAVLAAYEQIRRLFAADEDLRFAGHASFYGSSLPRLDDPTTTGAPVLMFLGGRDDNVSIGRSRLIADDLRRGGSAVEVRLFDDAHHQWNGGDVEKRFVRFGLAECCVRIGRDGAMRDETTGLAITGKLSRLLVMARSVSLRGYTILRNEVVQRRSDAMLLDFLDRACRQNPDRAVEWPRRQSGNRGGWPRASRT